MCLRVVTSLYIMREHNSNNHFFYEAPSLFFFFQIYFFTHVMCMCGGWLIYKRGEFSLLTKFWNSFMFPKISLVINFYPHCIITSHNFLLSFISYYYYFINLIFDLKNVKLNTQCGLWSTKGRVWLCFTKIDYFRHSPSTIRYYKNYKLKLSRTLIPS